MVQKIKAGAVSYLNTKPLIYGFEQGLMKNELDLVIDYPANVARMLQDDQIDIGLVPVAIIPTLKEHYIISDYCIGCDGEVASVCLFSHVPLNEIKTIVLDYQSKTSVALLKILLKEHWKITPTLVDEQRDVLMDEMMTTARLIIGDRALEQRQISRYTYDLGIAWKELTGLPFVFAVWVANKQLSAEFITAFNAANEVGFNHLDEVIKKNRSSVFDLRTYYTRFVKFKLDGNMQAAKALFLSKMNIEQKGNLKIAAK